MALTPKQEDILQKALLMLKKSYSLDKQALQLRKDGAKIAEAVMKTKDMSNFSLDGIGSLKCFKMDWGLHIYYEPWEDDI